MAASDINPSEIVIQINQLSESIVKYGFSVVIESVAIAIFICIILVMMRNHKKQMDQTLESNDNMIKSIVEQNNELVNNLTKRIKKDEEEHAKIVETYLDINVGLRSICKNIMNKINADRVAVYVFHNGNKSAHGLPFFKLSCIGEWAKQKNIINRRSQSDIPLYLFSEVVEELYKNGKVFIKNSSENENVSIIGTPDGKSMSIYSILDEYENLAGFTLLEFDSIMDFDNEKVLHKIKNIMDDISKTISDIIIYTDIEKRIENEKCCKNQED